jgi:hypothetical protein
MFQLDFVFVHVLVTDGRFLSAGSDQLHQDLDGHGPNLWQEVEGLYVRRLIWYSNERNKYTVKKWRYKKWWKYDEIFL